MDVISNVEDIDEVTKKVSVTVPEPRVSQEFEVSVGSLAKRAHLKGFRPGKAPKSVVTKLMGDRVRMDVANRLISETLRNVYEAHKLPVVGEPEIALDGIEPGKELSFSATISLFPSPEVSDYRNKQVEVERKVVSDKDVDEAIAKLRDGKAELKKIEDRTAARKGDVVALSVSIREEGDTSEPRPEPLIDELGAGRLPADAEDQLVGLEVGQTKEISTTLPEDYNREDLRGKKVLITAVLHGLFTKKLPELDDEFAKNAGLEVETVADLKAKLREQLVREADQETKVDAQGAILDALVNANPFKVPQVMVDDEIRGMLARYGLIRSAEEARRFDVEPFRERLGDVALNRIRCAVIVDRIAESESITVSDEDKERMIREVAEKNGGNVDATRKMLLNRQRIESFLLEVRRSKVLDFLVENSSITYKEKARDAA